MFFKFEVKFGMNSYEWNSGGDGQSSPIISGAVVYRRQIFGCIEKVWVLLDLVEKFVGLVGFHLFTEMKLINIKYDWFRLVVDWNSQDLVILILGNHRDSFDDPW